MGVITLFGSVIKALFPVVFVTSGLYSNHSCIISCSICCRLVYVEGCYHRNKICFGYTSCVPKAVVNGHARPCPVSSSILFGHAELNQQAAAI